MDDVKLIHGDCLEVMPTLPEESVQMVFADLPYATVHRKTTDCTWDIPIDLNLYWKTISGIASNATHIMTATQPFGSLLVCSNLDWFRYDLIWDRKRTTGHLNANRCPLRCHESILIFTAKQMPYYPQKVEGLPYIRTRKGVGKVSAFAQRQSQLVRIDTVSDGGRYPKSILSLQSENIKKSHPTQKPVALLEWLIKTYTNPGDTVLDPVAGSGTTAIAAMRTGRRSICIEKDATYFAVMQKRVGEERARMEQQEIAL